MKTKKMPEAELIALRKQKIAAMTEEDWQKQREQVSKRSERILLEGYERFVQAGIDRCHKERAEQKSAAE
jgi:hypothetical protein